MEEIRILLEQIQKMNSGNWNSYKESIKKYIDLVNRTYIDNDDKNKLHDILLQLIEKAYKIDRDFIVNILDNCISTNLDKSYFIEYLRIKELDNSIDAYTDYLNRVVNKKIVFHSEFDKQSFINILRNMCYTVNNEIITKKINDYISIL